MAGNHFNEWAGFDCEWELYPSKQAQEDWITAYVSGLKEWRGREVPPSDDLCSPPAEPPTGSSRKLHVVLGTGTSPRNPDQFASGSTA